MYGVGGLDDVAFVGIGVNISEQKSGTKRTKKRKKRELVVCPTPRRRNWYCSTSSGR